MDNLYVLYDTQSGSIVKVSSSEIDTAENKKCLKVDDEILISLNDSNSIDRLFTDFKVFVDKDTCRLIDQRKVTIDKNYNKLLPIPYIHRTEDANADIKLTITSQDNKPVLLAELISDKSIRLNQFQNKTYIYLTDKNDANLHYQTFEIDLNNFESKTLFDIDRCDYKKLFANNISFYHRKKLNIVYTII